MLVVNTKSTAYIDVLGYDVVNLQLVLQLVDTIAQSLEVAHIKYLRTNVEMQTDKLDIIHTCSLFDYIHHIFHGNTEFVFCQTGCDIGMSMCAHVGVDTECHSCHLVFGSCELVDDIKFGKTLHIKAEDVLVKTEINLPVALSYTGIHYSVSWESSFASSFNLTATHAVGTKTGFADYGEQLGVGIGLNGIMHLESLVLTGFVVDSAQCAAKQFGVVVVERCSYFLELSY